jgi:hypothetical protein
VASWPASLDGMYALVLGCEVEDGGMAPVMQQFEAGIR